MSILFRSFVPPVRPFRQTAISMRCQDWCWRRVFDDPVVMTSGQCRASRMFDNNVLCLGWCIFLFRTICNPPYLPRHQQLKRSTSQPSETGSGPTLKWCRQWCRLNVCLSRRTLWRKCPSGGSWVFEKHRLNYFGTAWVQPMIKQRLWHYGYWSMSLGSVNNRKLLGGISWVDIRT